MADKDFDKLVEELRRRLPEQAGAAEATARRMESTYGSVEDALLWFDWIDKTATFKEIRRRAKGEAIIEIIESATPDLISPQA